MVTVARIETGDSKITIDEVKNYIHLIGNERDDELQVMLDAATIVTFLCVQPRGSCLRTLLLTTKSFFTLP